MTTLRFGRLTLADAHGVCEFGASGDAGERGVVQVHRPAFYRSIVLGGGLGGAESYLRGDWDSPDLVATMRVLARNSEVLVGLEASPFALARVIRSAVNGWKRNTRAGSRRNIAAHYDLSNDFFALMLDPTMTYSSGIFPTPEATLEQASVTKYDRICRKLELSPEDEVLEIGTGWGGFAEHAAKNYGCRVTTTTISQAQYEYAAERFRKAGIERRVTLLKADYRDLRGEFDKLVSIEMIEAVGERFLPVFFAKCSQLLKPHGMLLLQAITIPDYRYDRYRRSVDFIQQYIFPGGFLPSLGAMAGCVGNGTDFRFLHLHEYGLHYARTLAQWRENFTQNIQSVRALGFDRRFVRMWHYYLCYCEAGFRERQIGVAQLLLAKPACRSFPGENF